MHPILQGIRAGYIMPDGSPRHAEADGWYWLAGALGGAGERDHGGNGSPPASRSQCLERFASMMRIGWDEAWDVAALVVSAASQRARFAAWVSAQRPRWALEAHQARAAETVSL